MSNVLSRQTCLSVDSQSLASENGVILILSSLISWSSTGADAVDVEDEDVIEGGGEPLFIGVLGIRDGP